MPLTVAFQRAFKPGEPFRMIMLGKNGQTRAIIAQEAEIPHPQINFELWEHWRIERYEDGPGKCEVWAALTLLRDGRRHTISGRCVPLDGIHLLLPLGTFV